MAQWTHTDHILSQAPCIATFTAGEIHPKIERVTAPPSLENTQKRIGGYVELVQRWVFREQPIQLYVDEEGRIKRPCIVNVSGTEFLRRHNPVWISEPPLVGTVVVLVGAAAVWK